MFRLTVEMRAATRAGDHRTREDADAAVEQWFATTGHVRRLLETSWTHTRYEITDGSMVLGHATVDEICGCEHTHREHDDVGCTVAVVGRSRLQDCECRCYQPICDDPTLFDIEALHLASSCEST